MLIIIVILPTEVTVILLVEFAVGIVAIVSGFGFKHTYFVSAFRQDFFIEIIFIHFYFSLSLSFSAIHWDICWCSLLPLHSHHRLAGASGSLEVASEVVNIKFFL